MIKQIFLVLTVIVFAFASSPNLYYTSSFAGLQREWALAYSTASDVIFERMPIANVTLDGNVTVLNDYEFRMENLTVSLFTSPLVSSPIALVYNIPALSGSMNLTDEEIVRMITANITRWNNAELVSHNPGLSVFAQNHRFVYLGGSSPITQVILEYFFPEEAPNQNGTWAGIVSGGINVLPTQGYASLVPVLAGTNYGWGFAPLSTIMAASASNLKEIVLIRDMDENGTALATVGRDAPLQLDYIETDRSLVYEYMINDETWPLNIMSYIVFDEDKTQEAICENNIASIRYYYWALDNKPLDNVTQSMGFTRLTGDDMQTSLDHILTAMCAGKDMLVYENLSGTHRSNALLGISIVIELILMGMIITTWSLNARRFQIQVFGNYLVVLLGLLASMASCVLWWYTPSSTSICVSRYWTIFFGYLGSFSSLLGYTFLVNAANTSKSMPDKKKPIIQLFGLYIVLGVIQFAIALVGTILENLHSEDVVVDELKWQEVTQCATKYGIVLEIVNPVVFCAFGIFGWYVIYRFWKKEDNSGSRAKSLGPSKNYGPDDPRWILFALYAHIFIFVLMIVFTKMIHLSDDSLYIIMVPLFLVAQTTVISGFFVPLALNDFKRMRSKGSSGSTRNIQSSPTFDLSGANELTELPH